MKNYKPDFKENLALGGVLVTILIILYSSATKIHHTHTLVHYKNGTVKEYCGQANDSISIDYIYIINKSKCKGNEQKGN